jgi:citrate lyase beta subunit
MTRPLHSLLYLPANRASAIAKARTLPADAVLLDLEDAVQPDAKPEARAAAVAAKAEGGWEGKRLLLRVNGFGTPWQAEDFAAVMRWWCPRSTAPPRRPRRCGWPAACRSGR